MTRHCLHSCQSAAKNTQVPWSSFWAWVFLLSFFMQNTPAYCVTVEARRKPPPPTIPQASACKTISFATSTTHLLLSASMSLPEAGERPTVTSLWVVKARSKLLSGFDICFLAHVFTSDLHFHSTIFPLNNLLLISSFIQTVVYTGSLWSIRVSLLYKLIELLFKGWDEIQT